MKCRIDDGESLLEDATKTWSELEELPARLDLKQSIQSLDTAVASIEEEAKSLGALAKMKKRAEINQIQDKVQKLREKHITFDKMVQPYQEEIAQLVDTMETKVAEFKSSKEVIDSAEDPLI